jgi:hypothetical protein
MEATGRSRCSDGDDNPGENISHVGERIDIVQLTGFNQGRDDGPMLGAAVRTCKQRVFPVQRDRTDGAFDGVVVELNAAIIDEARQALPTRERITDGVGEFALLADQTELCAQPPLECLGKRQAFLVANEATLLGAAAAYILLYGVQFGDALQRLARNRRGPGVASS